MMPPICEVCGREFNPDVEGGLIYFRETERGRAFEQKARDNQWTGHPPDAAWFCGAHSGAAEEWTHLTLDAALQALNKKYRA
jgi:hypothetical protein